MESVITFGKNQMRLSELKLKAQGKIRVTAPIKGVMSVGRNELCPCDSGMKFKFCCWKKYTGNLGERK